MLDRLLPICKKYGAAVVGLTLDENGIPALAEQRFALAQKIVAAAEAAGIPREDVYIDCLTLTASAPAGSGAGNSESRAHGEMSVWALKRYWAFPTFLLGCPAGNR